MKTRTSTYYVSYHQTTSSFYNIFCMNVELVRVPLSLYTRTSRVSHCKLKWNSSYVNSLSSYVASNFDVQQPNFSGPHGVLSQKEIHTIGLRIEIIPMKPVLNCLAWHPLFYWQKKLALQLSSIVYFVSMFC